jgi:4-hydroxybenzoate polyprenyltransferase
VANRWWVYQRERFPLAGHAPLIAAFSWSALCASSLLRGEVALPSALAAVVSFVTALLFFLQLRIADEFKDFEEDARFRPYRPVPRGLVSLRELGVVGALAAACQLALAWLLQPDLILLLLGVWLYLAFMSKEFFVGPWLKARPILYMLSHMAIIPLVDLYTTACDWRPAGAGPPTGLNWFLAVSYCNGIVLELGRKIRPPEDEEVGVETYSFLWGRRNATFAWLTALLVNGGIAAVAGWHIDFFLPILILLGVLLLAAAWLAWRFLAMPTTRGSKMLEALSGIWTLLMYLNLGVIPLLLRWWQARGETAP